MPMGRRDFLTVSSASLVLAACGSASAGTTRKRKLKKAVKYGMVQDGETVLAKFQLLKELGFDGVEIDSPSNLDLEEVNAARDATGLLVPGVVDSVHWQKPFSHPDEKIRAQGRAGLETALRDAAQVGATTVLLVPAVVNGTSAYDDAYRRSQAEIRKLLPLAQELRVKIALENVWNQFLLSPLEAARYVDEFESEWIGWYLDVGNLVNYAWPEQWIRILGKRVLKLDIKEFSRKQRDDEGLWKGFDAKLLEGDCNWPEVMKAVDEIGYEGFATAEIRGGGREWLKETAERMDRIFAS